MQPRQSQLSWEGSHTVCIDHVWLSTIQKRDTIFFMCYMEIFFPPGHDGRLQDNSLFLDNLSSHSVLQGEKQSEHLGHVAGEKQAYGFQLRC